MKKKKRNINFKNILYSILLVPVVVLAYILTKSLIKGDGWNIFADNESTVYKDFDPVLLSQSRLTNEEAKRYAVLLDAAMTTGFFHTDSFVISQILLTTPFEENDVEIEAYDRFEFGAAEFEHISVYFGEKNRSLYGSNSKGWTSWFGIYYLNLGEWLKRESSNINYQAISGRYSDSSVF